MPNEAGYLPKYLALPIPGIADGRFGKEGTAAACLSRKLPSDKSTEYH